MKRLSLLILLCFMFSALFAQNNRKMSDLKKKREEALEKVEKASKQLNKTRESSKNSIYKLNLISDKIKVREQVLTSLDSELKKLDNEINDVKSDYVDLSRDLSVKKEQYAKSLRLLSHRNKAEDKLMFILSAKDMNQMSRRMRYLSEYSLYQKIQAKEITRKQSELNEKWMELEQAYNDKKVVRNKQAQEKSELDKEKEQESELIKSLKGQEKKLSAEVSRQRKLADKLDRQIQALIIEEARKASEQAAKDRSRKAETKGGYAMTKKERQLSGDFSKNRGLLPFPVSEGGTIVVHFGEQKYQNLKYVQNDSKGIDIKTRPGASAVAVFDGVVSKVFSLPGFNNSIIIRHGNYLSVYANLVTINVTAGQRVKTGQHLGKIFVDSDQGNLTVMHFQLWKDTQRLNPEIWLRK